MIQMTQYQLNYNIN